MASGPPQGRQMAVSGREFVAGKEAGAIVRRNPSAVTNEASFFTTQVPVLWQPVIDHIWAWKTDISATDPTAIENLTQHDCTPQFWYITRVAGPASGTTPLDWTFRPRYPRLSLAPGADDADTPFMGGSSAADTPATPEYLRASDAERDRAISALRQEFVEGRLSQETFMFRVQSALGARQRGQLTGLFTDLPPRRARLLDRMRAALPPARERHRPPGPES